MNYQLYLFDFDGLLVDTEPLHYISYKEMCQRRGFELKWDYPRFCLEAHGKLPGIWDGLVREFPKLYESAPKDVLYEEKKQIYVELLRDAELQLMPGVDILLGELEKTGISRAVVTNSPRDQIEIIKQKIPILQTIPLWVTREDYQNAKPAPDGYLQAIAKTGVKGRIIGFEDTLKGLKALVAAGVESVLICSENRAHVKESIDLGAKHFENFDQYLTQAR